MEAIGKAGKGQPGTARRIMTAMAKIALVKGLDALSMRDVAKRADLSLAALQYHFASKDALIAAFVDTMLETYRTEVSAIRSASAPSAELRNIVVYAVGQTLDDRTGHIFAMLEARARHDQSTARALDGFMQSYLALLSEVLLRRHPHLPLKHVQLGAMRIVAMIEGLSSVRSAAEAMGLSRHDLCEAVASMAEAINA